MLAGGYVYLNGDMLARRRVFSVWGRFALNPNLLKHENKSLIITRQNGVRLIVK